MRLDPNDEDYLHYLDSLNIEQLHELDDGTNADVLVAIAKKFKRQRKYTAAESYCELAIELTPDEPWPRLFLGNLYFSWNKHSRALAQFESASKLAPDVACPYWCIADIYAAMLQDELATEMYEKAVSVDPGDMQASQKLEEWKARNRD